MATTLTIYRTNTDQVAVNKCCFNMSVNTAILHYNKHISSMNTSGIYKIQSKIKPGRIYIGSAVNFRRRWNEHLCLLRKQEHHSFKLQNHFNKYGEDDLQFSIIEPCLPMFLTAREQHYIDNLKPKFNVAINASNPMLGLSHSKEAKLKLSKSNKGKKRSKEFCDKMRLAWTKRAPANAETRKKMSIARKGRHHSEEAKEKIRIASSKHRHSEETKKKLSLMRIGFKHSEESKKKMSEILKGNHRNKGKKRAKKIA